VIKDVRDLALRSILFSIIKLEGSTNAHLASKSQISYAIQCLEPKLFNWSVRFLRNVKEQISKCKTCCRLTHTWAIVEEIFNPLSVSLGESIESMCCHLILKSSV
jgi:hypothetical protein